MSPGRLALNDLHPKSLPRAKPARQRKGTAVEEVETVEIRADIEALADVERPSIPRLRSSALAFHEQL